MKQLFDMKNDNKLTIAIRGTVVHGRKKGRELGFPTANLDTQSGLLENGVYGTYVLVKGNEYWGIMNIGVKPTFGSSLAKSIEVHLLDFNDEIYDEKIECHILFKIREERRFSSIEGLKQQIKEDIRFANQQFKLPEFTDILKKIILYLKKTLV
jgi:riboflavin kinase/FMN adenylyltransferase